MYTSTTVQDSIFGSTPLVGWKQDDDPSQNDLDSALVTSTSGKFFQDVHPLLTLRNVWSIAPRFEDYIHPTWLVGTNYVIGNIVTLSSVNYIALTANIGKTPASNPSDWAVWTNGNEKSKWLKDKTRGYILQVIDDVLDNKKWGKTAKSIIEERALFDGTQYEGEVTKSEGNIAAFEIKVARSMGVLAKLDRIGFEFSGTGSFTLKLYHSSQSAAIQSKVITITQANTMEWFDLGFEIPYLSVYDAGGSWTLEYDQNEAPGDAINKAKDWSAQPAYRNGFEYSSWKMWSQYLEFHPYTVPVADRKDPRKRTFLYTSNFGMNLTVSVYCDFTGFLTRQKNIFSGAIAKGVGMKFLHEIAINANSRINQNESTINISKDDILFEIFGNTQGRNTGLKKEYDLSINAIDIDTQGLMKICMPCGRKGIKWKTT